LSTSWNEGPACLNQRFLASFPDSVETAEIRTDPAALGGLAEAREAEQAGDVVYGTDAARALLAERKQ
jgi:hypothetical protein